MQIIIYKTFFFTSSTLNMRKKFFVNNSIQQTKKYTELQASTRNLPKLSLTLGHADKKNIVGKTTQVTLATSTGNGLGTSNCDLPITKPYKIDIYAYSHGQGIAAELRSICTANYEFTSIVKPGASFRAATSVPPEKFSELNSNDFSVFLAGTNDVKSKAKDFILSIKQRLLEFRNTNVIIFSTPQA